MKSITLYLSFFCLLLLVFSCSTVRQNETAIEQNPIIEGKNNVDRPDWIYKDFSNDQIHYVAGYGKMSNLQNSIKRAQAEAKNLIAEWISTAVDEIIITYINDAGTDTNKQAMDAFEVVSRQRAQAILSGIEQVDMWEDKDGGIWVLLSIPVENVKSQMYRAWEEASSSVEDFNKSDAAKEANKMMENAINVYFNVSSNTN